MAILRKKLIEEADVPAELVSYFFKLDPPVSFSYVGGVKNGMQTVNLHEPVSQTELDEMLSKMKSLHEKELSEPKPEVAVMKEVPKETSESVDVADLEKGLLEIIPEAPELEAIPEAKKPVKSKPKKRIRSVQVMTRLTPEESETFHKRVESTGQTQADYIRSMILTGMVKELPKNNPEILQLITELSLIKRDLGRIGGLLKSTIKSNENNVIMTEEDKQLIKDAVRDIQNQQRRVNKEINKIWL